MKKTLITVIYNNASNVEYEIGKLCTLPRKKVGHGAKIYNIFFLDQTKHDTKRRSIKLKNISKLTDMH